jgi:hypothetical protein
MRTIALLALLLLATPLAWTQNPNTDFKYAVKLGNRSTIGYSVVSTPSGLLIQNPYLIGFHLVPSFLMRSAKGNFTEFSLDNIGFNLPNQRAYGGESYQPVNMNLHLMAARYLTLRKVSHQRWVPMVGLALAPSFSISRSYQLANGLTIRHGRGANLYTYLAPRLAYFSTKRVFVDFEANINLLAIGHTYQSREYLDQPNSQLTYNTFYLRLIPSSHQFRIGVGLKL